MNKHQERVKNLVVPATLNEAWITYVSHIAVSHILDEGLAKSTWREQHNDAYVELLAYRTNLIASVTKALKEHVK